MVSEVWPASGRKCEMHEKRSLMSLYTGIRRFFIVVVFLLSACESNLVKDADSTQANAAVVTTPASVIEDRSGCVVSIVLMASTTT